MRGDAWPSSTYRWRSRTYRPDVAEPADFDEFWADSIREARALGGTLRFERQSSPLRVVDVEDVTFAGFGGEPIKGWLTTPAGADRPLPVVVEFIGYGGGRGAPVERLAWAAAGYAHLVMDTRGQGAGWGTGGATPDPHGSGPAGSGFLTRGITSPATSYYRRVFIDAVRAVDAVRTHPLVDPDRVAVTGTSQGGGIALAAGALADDVVAVMPDVPFLCHIDRAIRITDRDPYAEVVRYLAARRGDVEVALATLSYLDGVSFAKRTNAPALFSVGLCDATCPPSTVFAAFNHYAAADKAIEVYPFNDHEGGQSVHWERQVAFLERVLGERQR